MISVTEPFLATVRRVIVQLYVRYLPGRTGTTSEGLERVAALGHDSSRPQPASPGDRPARLVVGVVSAGRVGAALGAALERVGHVVGTALAVSDAARERAARLLPDTRRTTSLADTVASAELVLVAVPDTALPSVVAQIAETSRDHRGRIVLHTAGARGVEVLAPLAARGAMCAAVHPAMTFTDDPADVDRLAEACFGVTADDEVAGAIAQALVLEIGGEPVPVAETDRVLYHAAMAHGANHLVTLINDAVDVLAAALARGPGHDPNRPEMAARMLAPLAAAALDNALRRGDAALTGPVARGDAATVAAHLSAVEDLDPALGAGYRAAALRTARRAHRPAVTAAIEETR